MDNLIECTKCGSNACYMQEITLGVSLHWCYGCGFTSNTSMKSDSDFLKSQLEILPELYKVLMVEDETGKIWMPSVINIPDKGMVFADGTGADNWKWAGVKAVPVKEEEKEKFKLKGGGFAEWKMDMTTIKHFDEKDYIEVLSYLGILPE
jgi:hypothetical protein